jgi:hypothetical protein
LARLTISGYSGFNDTRQEADRLTRGSFTTLPTTGTGSDVFSLQLFGTERFETTNSWGGNTLSSRLDLDGTTAQQRMGAYLRLDASIRYEYVIPTTRRSGSETRVELQLGVYNMLNRANPWYSVAPGVMVTALSKSSRINTFMKTGVGNTIRFGVIVSLRKAYNQYWHDVNQDIAFSQNTSIALQMLLLC